MIAKKQWIPLALVALLSLPLTGCAAAAVAAVGAVGYTQYERNETCQDYDVELETAWEATLAALENLGYSEPATQAHGAMDGEIEERDLHVRMESHAEGHTRVKVRFGTFHTKDHKRKADLVIREISEELGVEWVPDEGAGGAEAGSGSGSGSGAGSGTM